MTDESGRPVRHRPRLTGTRDRPGGSDVTIAERRPDIDLYDAASFDGGQPHDQFDWLRANDPVHRHPLPDGRPLLGPHPLRRRAGGRQGRGPLLVRADDHDPTTPTRAATWATTR